MPDPRSQIGGIVFMAVWIVVWTAAILIAVYSLGAEALEGEIAAVLFLAIWIGAALFALSRAGRTLMGIFSGQPGPKRRRRHHRWNDDLPAHSEVTPAARQRNTGAANDGYTPPPAPPDAATDDGRGWTEMPKVSGRGARGPRQG